VSGEGEQYECAICHGTFTKTWSDEEARAELETTWQPQPGPVDIVCDDCFQQVMSWARTEMPGALRGAPPVHIPRRNVL
jgi:hypothetical protein